LLAYIATRSNIPEYVVAITPGLVSASNTFCYIVLTCISCCSI